jgi:hypothetical protein
MSFKEEITTGTLDLDIEVAREHQAHSPAGTTVLVSGLPIPMVERIMSSVPMVLSMRHAYKRSEPIVPDFEAILNQEVEIEIFEAAFIGDGRKDEVLMRVKVERVGDLKGQEWSSRRIQLRVLEFKEKPNGVQAVERGREAADAPGQSKA